jgi:hypothetical protein
MTSPEYDADRHRRHPRHQPLNFMGLRATKASSSERHHRRHRGAGDAPGDGRVTRVSAPAVTRTTIEETWIFRRKSPPGDDGDAKFPILQEEGRRD